MYEFGYCSLLLLLCKRKLTTFSKDDIWYEYDVFSRIKQDLILPCRLNIAAVTEQPNQDRTWHSARHS